MAGAAEFDAFVLALRGLLFRMRATSDDLLADLRCSVVERTVLNELGRHGSKTVPDLALPRAVSRQAMQKTVDRLCRRGLVVKRVNPRHRRSPLLALTPAGDRLLAEIHARERSLITGATLPISRRELERTTRALRALERHFGDGRE